MPKVNLTRDQLEAVKLALESDIEASECFDPDYSNTWTMTYYKHRADALHNVSTVLEVYDNA